MRVSERIFDAPSATVVHQVVVGCAIVKRVVESAAFVELRTVPEVVHALERVCHIDGLVTGFAVRGSGGLRERIGVFDKLDRA